MVNDNASRQATWAGVEFWAQRIHDESTAQTATRVAQGIEGQRIDLVGVIPTFWSDWSGGMVQRTGLHPVTDLNQQYRNTGVQTSKPFQGTLGYKVVTQTNIFSGDFSGYRAANNRVHEVIFGSRFFGFIGSQAVKDTSTSNPAITVPSVSDAASDLCTALWTGMVGTTPAVFKGTDGLTDDTEYTTDPYANTIVWTKFVTQGNAADYVSAAQYFPALGSGNHVILARYNNSPTAGNGLWYVSKDASLPVTAPLPVVYKASKDFVVSGATAFNTAVLSPTGAGQLGQGANADGASGTGQVGVWVNPTNILADDTTYAVYRVVTTTGITTPLYAQYSTTTIPNGAVLVGATVIVNAKENHVDCNARFADVSLMINGSEVGTPRVVGGELTTSDADYTFGSSSDNWGVPQTIKGSAFRNIAVKMRFAFTPNTDNDISVDYVSIQIYYKIPGQQVILQSGGYTPGPWGSQANTLVYIEPESDDETGVTKARHAVFIRLSYDSEDDRVVAELEYPDTGLSYVEDACPYSGGVMFAGDKSSGLGKQLKLYDDKNAIRNYQYAGFHATAQIGVVSMHDEGPSLLIDMANEDATDTQWSRLVGTNYHFDYPPQSSSNAISSLPLAHAERTLHKPQNRIYRFFPVSTTAMACSYSFVPRNPATDVLSTNTTELKVDSAYIVTPIFEIGQVENENTFMLQRYEGEQISTTASTYGTVQWDFELSTDSTSIDSTFASPDVTTGAVSTPFGEYQVPSSGKPFRTMQAKITLTNAGSSAKTPNALPFYTETKSSRPKLSRLRAYVDWDATREQTETWPEFVRRLLAASATQSINPLVMGSINVPYDLVGWYGDWEAEDIAQPSGTLAKGAKGQDLPLYLDFQQVRGTA